MIHMIALRSCRSHNRGIRYGRAVIAAHRPRHTSGNGDNHQLRIGFFKNSDNNGDQDSEGSPACPCSEGKETTYQENDGRKQVHQPPAAFSIAAATKAAAPRLSVIAFSVHAKVSIRMAGTIALKPFGRHAMQSVKPSTLRTQIKGW